MKRFQQFMKSKSVAPDFHKIVNTSLTYLWFSFNNKNMQNEGKLLQEDRFRFGLIFSFKAFIL